MKSIKIRKLFKNVKTIRQKRFALKKEEQLRRMYNHLIRKKLQERRYERHIDLRKIRDLKKIKEDIGYSFQLTWSMVRHLKEEIETPEKPVYVDPKLQQFNPGLAAYLLNRIAEARKKRIPGEYEEQLEHYRAELRRLALEYLNINARIDGKRQQIKFGRTLYFRLKQKDYLKLRRKVYRDYVRLAYKRATVYVNREGDNLEIIRKQ